MSQVLVALLVAPVAMIATLGLELLELRLLGAPDRPELSLPGQGTAAPEAR